MSVKELAYNIIDNLSEQQLEGFVMMFGNVLSEGNDFNADTLEAFKEVEDMKKHPENYKAYDNAEEMIKEILG
jgi:hypothetical protein